MRPRKPALVYSKVPASARAPSIRPLGVAIPSSSQRRIMNGAAIVARTQTTRRSRMTYGLFTRTQTALKLLTRMIMIIILIIDSFTT